MLFNLIGSSCDWLQGQSTCRHYKDSLTLSDPKGANANKDGTLNSESQTVWKLIQFNSACMLTRVGQDRLKDLINGLDTPVGEDTKFLPLLTHQDIHEGHLGLKPKVHGHCLKSWHVLQSRK